MTSLSRPLPRRLALAASGTAVLAAAAACSSGTTASGTTASGSTSAASSESASSKATTSSATPSSSRPTTSAAASTAEAPTTSAEPVTSTTEQAPTGTPLASVADVESAGSVVVEAESGPVLLAYADGTVVAHTAICTHQQCTIAASGMCPCHGSRYNVTTGAVENGPALRPLAAEAVTVSNGQVYSA